MRLKEQVAIITGAGRGIGRAFGLRFGEEGGHVVLTGIDSNNAEKVAREIAARGGRALALRTDVSDEASTKEMAQKTMEQFGRIDSLINNAAIIYGIGVKPWDARRPEEWDKIFAVNVKGAWLCC